MKTLCDSVSKSVRLNKLGLRFCTSPASYEVVRSKTPSGRYVVTYVPHKKRSEKHIVFVHGEWVGKWFWEEHFTDYFASNGYACTAFDLRGHGEEAEPDEEKARAVRDTIMLHDYALDLHEVASTLKLQDKSPIFVGHGMAALVILKYLNTEFKLELELPDWAKQPAQNEMIKNAESAPVLDGEEELEDDPVPTGPLVQASTILLLAPYPIGQDRIPPHFTQVLMGEPGLALMFFKWARLFEMMMYKIEVAKKYYFPADMPLPMIESFYAKFTREPYSLLTDYYKQQYVKYGDKFRAQEIHIVAPENDKFVTLTVTQNICSLLGLNQDEMSIVPGSHCLPIEAEAWRGGAKAILDHLDRVGQIEARTSQILDRAAMNRNLEIDEIVLRDKIAFQLEENHESEQFKIIKKSVTFDKVNTLMATAYESKKPNGHSIVFVHGEWTGSWIWEENFMEYFAQRGYNSYSLDIYDYNDTTVDDNLGTSKEVNLVQRVSQKIAAVVSAFSIRSHVMVGHGLGASHVLAYLSSPFVTLGNRGSVRPALTVLMAPAPLPTDMHAVFVFTYALLAVAPWRERFSFLFRPGTKLFRPVDERSAKAMLFSETVSPHELEKYVKQMKPSCMAMYSTWKGLKIDRDGIRKSLLIISGSTDPLVTPTSLRDYSDYFGLMDSQLVSLGDISHMMMLDNKWYNVAQALETAIAKRFNKATEGEEGLSGLEDGDVMRFANNSGRE